MGLRGRIRRLDKLTRGVMVVIPQRDGTEARFPPEAGKEAFMNLMDRLGAGEDAPPEHPLAVAARNSSDPKWSGSFFAVNNPEEWTRPVEDLSE